MGLQHDRLLNDVYELEPLPQSVTALATQISREDFDIEEVVSTISFDPALTIRLLRAANSAASATREPIGTARAAVVRLGPGAVLSLAMASAVRSEMVRPIEAYRYTEGQLWRHSVACAVVAETASRFCEVSLPPETFTAALLHDIGKLVMSRSLDEETVRFMKRAREEGGLTPLEAEIETFGVHHGEVGSVLTEYWELPASIGAAIHHHHDPNALRSIVCDAVHMADAVASRVGEDLVDDEGPVDLDPQVAGRLGLTDETFEKFVACVAESLDEVMARYGG